MASNASCGLGGGMFQPLNFNSDPQVPGSTNNQGKHGASNFWGNWPKRGSRAGITARAPWNIGDPKTPDTIGGDSTHTKGLSLGPHGHGIGVVAAAIGGPHNARGGVLKIKAGKGGKILVGASLCPRCFGTWLLIGAAVVLIMIAGR